MCSIQVFGNTRGLKASQVHQLERLFRRRLPADRLLTNEFARQLSEISRDVRRQVGVLVDRRGDVQHVMVGDARGIELPDWGRLRAGRGACAACAASTRIWPTRGSAATT